MSAASNDLIGRPHWTARLAFASAGILMLAIGIPSVVLRQNPWGFFFLLAALFALTDLRRRVVVRDGELRARGRFTTRSVRLADLEQVAVSPMAVVWVQPRGARPFHLEMVSRQGRSEGEPGVWQFPGELRALATAAGARLEAWEEGSTLQPPKETHPVFSR